MQPSLIIKFAIIVICCYLAFATKYLLSLSPCLTMSIVLGLVMVALMVLIPPFPAANNLLVPQDLPANMPVIITAEIVSALYGATNWNAFFEESSKQAICYFFGKDHCECASHMTRTATCLVVVFLIIRLYNRQQLGVIHAAYNREVAFASLIITAASLFTWLLEVFQDELAQTVVYTARVVFFVIVSGAFGRLITIFLL